MAAAQASCIIVMEAQRLVGIFTQHDIVQLISTNLVLKTLTLADVMIREVVTLNVAEADDLFTLSQRFNQHRIGHLPVVDGHHQVVGMVTPATACYLFKAEYMLRAVRVGEVMTQAVIEGLPSDSLLTLAQSMTTHQVSCVVIADQERLPVGIVTEQDIVQFQALGLELAQLTAARVMSAPLCNMRPQDSLWQAHQTMERLHVRRLVITQPSGEIAGLVTQTQLLKWLNPVESHYVMQQIQATIERQTRQLQQLNQELQMANANLAHLATIDELTQLLNRRRLNECLATEWQRLARLGVPLSLIMCDIDDFKTFNDTYGHPAGDDCLVAIAQVLQQVTRQAMDSVARYGGEEFAIVLPHTDGHGAERVARDILQGVQQLQIPQAISRTTNCVTVSLGIATIIPQPNSSPKILLEAADQELYQSKQRGRNTYSFRFLATPSSTN